MSKPTTAAPRPGAQPEVRVAVGDSELPLHCPRPGDTLWNSHPRVFLAIEESGEARCPYCGTLYVLKRG